MTVSASENVALIRLIRLFIQLLRGTCKSLSEFSLADTSFTCAVTSLGYLNTDERTSSGFKEEGVSYKLKCSVPVLSIVRLS